MGSCARTAFTSLTRLVSLPVADQIEPGVSTSAAFSARTRPMYWFSATSGGVVPGWGGFGLAAPALPASATIAATTIRAALHRLHHHPLFQCQQILHPKRMN